MNSLTLPEADIWAARIAACWRASVESILEVGRLLCAAKDKLPHGDFGTMIESSLPFGARTAQMLMTISSDARITDAKHVSHLPPSWGTLYELSKLDDQEFERKISDGTIRPDMMRRDLAPRAPEPAPVRIAAPMSDSEVTAGTSDRGPAPVDAARPQAVTAPPAEEGEQLATTLPNGARSIMSSRQEPDDSLDFFPTPPWATRALMHYVLPAAGGWFPRSQAHSIWDPACGEGHMTGVLQEYSARVTGTDVFDYCSADGDLPPAWAGHLDFINHEIHVPSHDWIVTNPPFGDKTEAFVLRAIELATIGVAMFVRLQWLETIGRYERLFKDQPPTLIAFFCERVNLCKGLWDPAGSTATAYIWLVWIKGAKPRPPFWIPPGCREALSLPSDRVNFTAHPVRVPSIPTLSFDASERPAVRTQAARVDEPASVEMTDAGSQSESIPTPRPQGDRTDHSARRHLT